MTVVVNERHNTQQTLNEIRKSLPKYIFIFKSLQKDAKLGLQKKNHFKPVTLRLQTMNLNSLDHLAKN